MAPYSYLSGPMANESPLTPTDGRDVLHWKMQQPCQTAGSKNALQLNGQSSRSHTASQARLLTVDEALKYSPLSSIVPFNSEIIPAPTANHSCHQPIIATSQEQRAARQSLEILNDDMLQNVGHAPLAQETLKDLQSYLRKGAVTEFKFKYLPQLNGNHPARTSDEQITGQSGQSGLGKQLDPFASMLLNRTDLAYTYPSPSSSDTASPPKTANTRPHQPPYIKSQDQISERERQPLTAPSTPRNQSAFEHNAQLLSSGVQKASVPVQKQVPAVIVPPLPLDVRSSDYVVVQEDVSSTRKRKRGSEQGYVATGTQTRDQRAAADEASANLSDLVQEILEAEDQSHLETTGLLGSNDVAYFVTTSNEHGVALTLSQAIQVKLDSMLHKVISLGSVDKIPAENLSRLQRLCEGSIVNAEASDFGLETSWGDEDFQQWITRIDDVELGLRSARTTLRIMTSGREEKELYSEELLQSVVRLLDKLLKTCIIPVVESRNSEACNALFQPATPQRKVLSQLLYHATKVMGLLAELLGRVDMPENIINAVEFFATHVLFIENAHNEKDSLLGIQKFEGLRRTAMDMITAIFTRYPDQRSSIFDEILTSLQKLPTTRQQARQYKLAAGISIQLVSALILRLVQTSALAGLTKRKKEARTVPSSDMDSEQEANDNGQGSSVDGSETENGSQSSYSNALRRLSRSANSLSDSAGKSAQYVVRFFVSRAMTAPKSGDQPHRHLLDIFCEDLIAILGQPEWPAAELLLRALLVHLVEIAEKPKFNAPAKNMALELLGLMGSAISDLVASTRQAAKSLDNDESAFSGYLRQMLDEYMDGALDPDELLGWQGPYRAVVEHLQPNDIEDSQLKSAQAYYLSQWAKAVANGNIQGGTKAEKLVIQLRRSLSTSQWIASDNSEATSNVQIRLAYVLTILSMDFCRQFDRVLKILLDSISSEQITVRTRSLKSVTHMLEKDPTLLDRARNVKVLLMKCASDRSSMVRDSALMLIGKCVLLRPALEQEFCKSVLVLSNDAAVGVRKRAMKLLKDIYLRNNAQDLKAAICDTLLQRVRDSDKSVSDLARQTFEDIWMSPLWTYAEATEPKAQAKLTLLAQNTLIIKTLQRGENASSILVCLVKDLLLATSKNAAGNFKACKALVATAFDSMIDRVNEHESESQGQRDILRLLTVFAMANAQLFDADQLKHLQPYIANLSNADDLHLFRSTVIVFRCVLPTMPNFQLHLLREVQNALLQSVAKLGITELDEVAACLWTINGALKNPEKLVKLTISVIKNLYASKNESFTGTNAKDTMSRTKKYIRIAGYFGKHCDFDEYKRMFEDSLPWWKGTSVAGLIINCIFPFASDSQSLSLRGDAFNSISLICQSWPYQFNQEHISSAFEKVLIGDQSDLQNIVLSGFRDFFAKQERQSEAKPEESVNDSKEATKGKLGASMTASDSDGASALIAQRFLKSVLHIALASQDASALTATEVVASINRQGLVHPKESGPALVALETSTNPAIADIAFQEHRNLHQQHESMFEREYMKAVNEAFNYQKNIVKDTLGYTTQPYASKLSAMFDVIKTSKGKYQKKFLSGFCAKVDFEPNKANAEADRQPTLEFARFLIENLAFFDYAHVDDVLHAITCMERIVSSTGSGIAHNISTEVFQMKVDSILEDGIDGEGPSQHGSNANGDVDPSRLRQLTSGSIILACLWEVRTFLRRLYGLQSNQQRRESKSKTPAKDLNKAPSKMPGISGERLVTVIADKVKSLESHEAMLGQCKDFMELMSVDSEVKVTSEGEEGAGLPQTPSGDEARDLPMPASGGSRALKRKGSVSAATTPQKSKKGRPSLKRKQSAKSLDDDYESD